MANSDKLAEVVAIIHERDQEFAVFEQAKATGDEEPLWALSTLKQLLEYGESETLEKAVNRAKIAAGNSGMSIKDNFMDGTLFDLPGETLLTKYGALLVIMNADVNKRPVAIAQSYFALQVDRQRLEDEKRLKTRLEVATENHKLAGVAKEVGVENFPKFNGVGVAALYGGLTVAQIQRQKGLTLTQPHLDYAGSEELAANLFRITQTAAALRRQEKKSEQQACDTHRKVGEQVRRVIIQAGNQPPEKLPACTKKIDKLATEVKKSLK
jgi:DNA-damage-inducible protein D